MEHRYLLDTNAVSDLVRFPQGEVAKRIARVELGRIHMKRGVVSA